MNIKIIALLIPIVFLILVIELVRRGRLTFKYAFGWILLSLIAVFFIIFDSVLFSLAYGLGFQLPSNFVFFTILTLFVFLSLLLTTFISQQEEHNIKIAQRLTMLESEIRNLKK